ncbi:hypothetical protein AQUCO_10700002v1 [Aquilegia coerulea]|uniref:Uncharacterized protein n=1 Tax=Aquilegia coerulea TaxID=218851 RepID=A0A2G5C3M8_AQUCA|nr:hypothetical protein AQUCO_10700002v1 [Aquilegia coerulea]
MISHHTSICICICLVSVVTDSRKVRVYNQGLFLEIKLSTMEARDQLEEIHADILKKEALFVEERNRWVADHQDLYTTDMNTCFAEKCHWETEFKKTHLKPLYRKRYIAAKNVPTFWMVAMIGDKTIHKRVCNSSANFF